MIILCTNCDGLSNKKDELLLEATETKASIILVTEVRPKNYDDENPVTENDFILQGFKPYSNINESEKRGVAIYVSEDLSPLVTEFTFNNKFEEQTWIELKLRGNDKLLIGCIYRSGSGSHQNNNLLSTLFRQINQVNPSHLFVYGDFNFKGIDWNLLVGSNENENKFINAVQDSFLFQHVDDFTRYREGNLPSILDLIFTNEEGLVSNVDYLPPIGASDHLVLRAELNVYPDEAVPEPKFNYHKGDYKKISEHLNKYEWYEMMKDMGAEEAFKCFEDILTKLMNEFIPKFKHSGKNKRKKLWMNRDSRRQSRRKRKYFRRFLATRLDSDLQAAKKEAKALTRLTKKLRKAFERDIAKEARKNPKGFWRYCRSLMKTRADIGEILKADGTMTAGNEDKAKAFNDYFSSVFTREDTENIPVFEERHFQEKLQTVIITPDKVKKKLQKLKASKCAGPDGFHPRVLRDCADSLAFPLTLIFNKSLQEAHLPPPWKEANVKALYKNKGKKIDPGNYRPISLTSVVCKIMESIIRDDIITHMMSNNLFCNEQHGFVPGRSCVTQLLLCLEEWTDLVDQGYPVDIIYMDFQKAFDSVPHRRLIMKIKAYGIDGYVLKWLEDFLVGRRQRVVIGKDSSNWAEVVSGIPQGSVLGPLLFVIYINDIPNGIQSLMKIFADDTKMYRALKTPADNIDLQNDIFTIENWSKQWQMPFNVPKCHALHLGFNNQKLDYSVNSTGIESVKTEKDLGIVIDEKLDFNIHVLEMVKKANRSLGCIRRTIKYKDREIVLPLYKAYVRSRLEYGSSVWNPYQVQQTQRIERVQRRATKMIHDISHLDYETRLKELKLPSLQYRRRRADMHQVFKIINRLERIEPDAFFRPNAQKKVTRGHNKRFYKPKPRLNIRKNTFSVRVVNDWNSLPQNLIDSGTLEEFKVNLDEHWRSEVYKNPFDRASRQLP